MNGRGRWYWVEEGRRLSREMKKEKAMTKKRREISRIKKLNIWFPWLKVVIILVLVGGAVSLGWGWSMNGLGQRGEVVGSGEKEKEQSSGGGVSEKIGGKEGLVGPSDGGGSGKERGNEAGESGLGEGQGPKEMTEREKKEQEFLNKDFKGKKLVALTFDDGPRRGSTDRLLEILKRKQVSATFFMLGSMARMSPDIVKRAWDEGHEVESHTTYHQDLSRLGDQGVMAELNEARDIIKGIIGVEPKLLRPPYGAVSPRMRQIVPYAMINWNVDPEDWKPINRNSEIVKRKVLESARDGAVILMHDIHDTTVGAVEGIIDGLRARGFEMVTVGQLAKIRGVNLVRGQLYFEFS